MGFGLRTDDVKRLAFEMAEIEKISHPFVCERAGRDWLEGFRRRHPGKVYRQAEGLSCARARQANRDVISDYFGKLTTIVMKLDLLDKPGCIFNADKTVISCVHKPTKVLAKEGSRWVFSDIWRERPDTHRASLWLSVWASHSTYDNIPLQTIVSDDAGSTTTNNFCNFSKWMDRQ